MLLDISTGFCIVGLLTIIMFFLIFTEGFLAVEITVCAPTGCYGDQIKKTGHYVSKI